MDLTPAEVLSTYRVQMHAGFTFDDLRRALSYLADLGVTHAYLSPISTSTPGSTHGYDVTDPARLNPELGGEEAYRALVEVQRSLGLGQVLDIVPNHMGIAPGARNTYWDDVLKHGRESQHASMFDVDWAAHPQGRVILPILGAPLNEVISSGDLEVDATGEGTLILYDNPLPLAPGTFESWRASEGIPALLAGQHYELAFWRDAVDQLNYRRFFAINELIGIRPERSEVFELVHRLPLELVARGDVDGLRIDHIDGLRDPEGYLARLRTALADAGRADAYLVVEKILEADEPLPPTWDCEGTSGYDAMNEFTRVLLQPAGMTPLDEIERRISGRTETYEEIADGGREHVVRELLGGQFQRLASRLFEALRPPAVTSEAFGDSLLTLLARVEPYRTYHREGRLDVNAPAVIHRAVEGLAPSPALEAAREALAAPPDDAALEVVLSLQQIMPAVQAKGIEDRTLFRYRRLMALNEVGSDPSMNGETVEVFHQRMQATARDWPRRMLTTATHDHKLGEDVRTRLVALAELPDEWERSATAALDVLARGGDADRVHPSDQYLLLQMIIGAHPRGMRQGRAGDEDFSDRLAAYMTKALREAAERTDWIDGDEAYEEAVLSLVRDAAGSPALTEALRPVMDVVTPAGAINGLAQTLLKLAAPGVPDTYQGNEWWDLSLVDPDNRRPVDFEARRTALEGMATALEDGSAGDEARAGLVPGLVHEWRDARIKQFVVARTLRLRRRHPDLFLRGEYAPIEVNGEHASHAIAYARRSPSAVALVVVPRFPVALTGGAHELWAPAWGNTTIEMPSGAPTDEWTGEWLDAFTGAVIPSGTVKLADVLGAFPVALLLTRNADEEA